MIIVLQIVIAVFIFPLNAKIERTRGNCTHTNHYFVNNMIAFIYAYGVALFVIDFFTYHPIYVHLVGFKVRIIFRYRRGEPCTILALLPVKFRVNLVQVL